MQEGASANSPLKIMLAGPIIFAPLQIFIWIKRIHIYFPLIPQYQLWIAAALSQLQKKKEEDNREEKITTRYVCKCRLKIDTMPSHKNHIMANPVSYESKHRRILRVEMKAIADLLWGVQYYKPHHQRDCLT